MQIRTASVLQIGKINVLLYLSVLNAAFNIFWSFSRGIKVNFAEQMSLRAVCRLCLPNPGSWDVVVKSSNLCISRKKAAEPLWWLSCWDCKVIITLQPFHTQPTYCVPLSFAEEDAGSNLPVTDRLNEKWGDYHTMSSVLIFTCTYALMLSIRLI